MLAALEGSVTTHADYVAVRTPSCPTFWWGNFVLFSAPPRPGCAREWEEVFDAELAGVSGIEHRNFAWDRTDGEIGAAADFIDAGYQLTESIFMMARTLHRSARHRTDVRVLPIESDVEWSRALRVQHQSLDPARDTPGFRRFQTSQLARHRRLVERGHGKWFGAYEGPDCVAAMGVFILGGLARCQAVATLPGYRRRGYCSTLLHVACEHAFREMSASEIVIMTDASNAAARVYESVGFCTRERVASLSISRRGPGSAPSGRSPAV